MKHIKHLFFDLDHTLWDFDKNSRLTFEFLFKKHQLTVNFEAFMKSYEVINLNYWKLYREEKINKKELRFNRLNETFLSVNFKADADLIQELSEDYIKYLSEYNYLFDGTLEVLAYLKLHYSLHIITNGFTEVQQKKIDKSGLTSFFTTITDAEMVGVKKPNCKIFNEALQKANANLNESIMIGDSYEADVLGAINCGLEALFFNPYQQKNPKNIKEVNHLLQLKTIFTF